jgi:monoamine oxidase
LGAITGLGKEHDGVDAVESRPTRDARCATVAVLGAGISGLVSAYELERLGYDVVVLEADSRIGGRVFTHQFNHSDGLLAELGAMRIPVDHHLVMKYVNELGIRHKLRPFLSILSDPNNYMRVGGDLVRVRNALTVLTRNTEKYFRGVPYRLETLLFVGWLHAMVCALAPRELRELVRADIPRMLPLAARLDLAPFVSHGRVDLGGAFRAYPELRTTCSSRLESFLDDIIRESGADMVYLAGGMAQLTDGIAGRLRGSTIRTGQEVIGIDVRRDGVSVRLADGQGRSVVTYPIVLCTIPFSVLRRLPLTGVDMDKLDVIKTLDYCSATKVALHCREAFWTRDGIAGGGSASGGRIRQTYYPTAGDSPVSGAVLLGSYTIAEDADVLGRLPETARHAAVADELRDMHPELGKPETVLETVSVAWGEQRWSRGCAARRWGLTESERAREASRAARSQGRLFFAGEHCSASPAWINAGIGSALHAVTQIDELARLTGDRDLGKSA